MRGLEVTGSEEALGLADQRLDAAEQPVRRDRILEQAPDSLDGVVLVGGVLGQPQQAEAGVLGLSQPRAD